jgi:hypothetical protein
MAWRAEAGPLQVTHVNARGDANGWVAMPGANGVHVAEVVEDVAAENTGGVEIFPMGVKVYQSALQETIIITGAGFQDGMSLTLDPPMVAGTDYKLKYINEHQLQLTLQSGKKWRKDPGLIMAKKVKVGGKEYALAGKEGIRIAVVLADPIIRSSSASYHESQSKLIVIEGSGFTTVTDTTIMIRPTNPAAYKVIGVMDDAIRVQLQPTMDWLPTFASMKNEAADKKIELQVASINTGAGDVVFPTPITVGYIVKDREGVVCDDSCEFAFDGVCDDGSEPKDQYYYENYGNLDDDMGGFYYAGDDEGDDNRRLQGLDDDEGGDDMTPYGGGYYDDYYMENEDYQVGTLYSCMLLSASVAQLTLYSRSMRSCVPQSWQCI